MKMPKIDRPRRACRPPMRFGVAAGLLVAVLVLAGCGDDDGGDSTALPGADDASTTASAVPTTTLATTNAAVAFTESDALGIVEAYYTAVEAGDADAITALFVDPTSDFFVEDLLIEVWNAGQDMIRVDRTCTTGDPTPEEFKRWTCEFGDHQYLQRAAGAPATQIEQTFTVSEDGIEDVDLSYITDGYGANDAFNAWMSANHPDDAAATRCCGQYGSIEEARADGELRRQYAELWAVHLQDTGCTYKDIGC